MGGNYNGFTAAERHAAGNIIRRAKATGTLSAGGPCSVCGCDPGRSGQMHLEDYRRALEAFPVCRRCHHAIHIRFHRPAYWLHYISLLDADGWFHRLSLDPTSLTRPFDETYPEGLSLA